MTSQLLQSLPSTISKLIASGTITGTFSSGLLSLLSAGDYLYKFWLRSSGAGTNINVLATLHSSDTLDLDSEILYAQEAAVAASSPSAETSCFVGVCAGAADPSLQVGYIELSFQVLASDSMRYPIRTTYSLTHSSTSPVSHLGHVAIQKLVSNNFNQIVLNAASGSFVGPSNYKLYKLS